MAKRETARQTSTPMKNLVGEFGQLVLEYADKAAFSLRAAGLGDDAEVAMVLREGLRVQTASLARGLSEVMGAVTDQQRGVLETQAAGSGGIELVRAARTSIAKTPALQVGIIDAIEPIKKIIRQILDVLGIELPKWIVKLLDFIDNILKLLTGLFGREASQRAERAQTGMYRHLREIYKTEAASLSRLGRGGTAAEEDNT
jgi:hypothetical protein